MHIDWRAAFYCANGAANVTADGICIGHKLTQCCIVRPWEAAPDAAIKPGTVLRSRLMVQEPRCRKRLLQFTSASAGGLSADELEQLEADMTAVGDSEPEATIAPFLGMTVDGDDGRLLSAPPYRQLLRSLGTTAPAIQLLPSVLWGAALELKDQGQLGFRSEAALQRFSPLLSNFLQPHLTSDAVPNDVITFVDMLRQVGRCVE